MWTEDKKTEKRKHKIWKSEQNQKKKCKIKTKGWFHQSTILFFNKLNVIIKTRDKNFFWKEERFEVF